jgi:hypothetical protein
MTIALLGSRRWLLAAGSGLMAAQLGSPALAAALAGHGPNPDLLRRATLALQRHATSITAHDVIAIADFSVPSSQPRLHLIRMAGGEAPSLLVAHGRGSDPDHSGWVKRFSNAPGSFASSAGAYLVGDLYIGKHGRSRRLTGLDPDNCNAEGRAIVVHAARYVSPEVVRQQGKLGRSEGCFAVPEADLEQILGALPQGSLLYADKA